MLGKWNPRDFWQECRVMLWKTVWWFLKKFSRNIPSDPAMSFWGKYLKKSKERIQRVHHHVHSNITRNAPKMEEKPNVHKHMNGSTNHQ